MNKRFENVGYNRLRISPNQQTNLIGVARAGGEAMAGVANNLFNLANQFGQYADEDARYKGRKDGELAALAGAPQVTVGKNSSTNAEPKADYAGGPIKLLKNANAVAVNDVGAQALMSAGDVAKKRTGKRGGKPARLSNGSKVAGKAQFQINTGTFKPTGRNTIYDRAYDAAGTKTYLQLLDVEVHSTSAQLYEKYKDDPVQLEQAFTALAKEQMREHVQPEFMAAYATTFQSVTENYMLQARKNVVAQKKQEELAAFIGQTNELETRQQQQIEALDPTAQTTATQVAQSQAMLAQHYDEAVRKGIMTQKAAVVAKQKSQRNSAVKFYLRQAELRDGAGVQQMIDDMSADFADGGIDGIDGAGWQTLKSSLASIHKTKLTEGQSIARSMRKQGDDMAARIAFGYDVNPQELSELMLESKAAPEGEKEMAQTLAKIDIGEAIRDLSLVEARDRLTQYKKEIGRSPTETELRVLAFAQSMLQQKQEALSTDPITYAERNGLVAETASLLTAENPEDMAAILSQRILHGQTASEHYGVAAKFLKDGEAKALGEIVMKDPENGSAIAGALITGAGDQAERLLQEFGQDAPAILESGAIISIGGSQRAARDVLAGYSKEAKVKLPVAVAKEKFEKTVGVALLANEADTTRIQRAAAAITRKRLTEEGIDKDSAEAIDVYTRAVQEASGATFASGVQFGGFYKYDPWYFQYGQQVLVPPNVRADKFEELIAAIRDSDFTDKKKAPLQGVNALGDALPLATKNGYIFYNGSSNEPRFIANNANGIFILPLKDMLPDLAMRVPSSVRGQ